MKAAILGTTGYTGLVLLRLLTDHPDVDQILPVSSTQVGTPLLEVDPGVSDLTLSKVSASNGKLMSIGEVVAMKPDVVFAALPHLKSAEVCAPFFGLCPVIDLSADFRIKDCALFLHAYGQEPPRPDLLDKAVYGLSEWNHDAIAHADLIANPGCYPTASLLPILPLAAAGMIGPTVIINALSGVSGAGRSAKTDNLFCERSENMNAYKPGKSHRHQTEIQIQLDERSKGLEVLFTPHLIPIKQGEFITTVVELMNDVDDSEIAALFHTSYGHAPFVRIQTKGIPETRQVRNPNRCDIGWHREGRHLILFSVLDNLIKGASGQAVQNMNIRFGIDETAGLRRLGEF